MLVSRLLVSVFICVVSASIAGSETNAPAADAAIQVADGTPGDADLQASKVASIQAGETGEDRGAVKQAQQQQQLANQPMETDQQSLMAAPGELKDPDPSASAGAVQPPTQNADGVVVEALSAGLSGTDAQLDASQTEKLAAIEGAATGQDREALGKCMQDANAAVQAAAFDAWAAHDNPAAVEKLLAEIKDVSQPVRLQALQLLTESPQADEQTVMTTLIDALNGADPSFSSYAAQALAERGTPEAMNALTEMLNSADPSTRLMVLHRVAQTEAGLPLLRAALSDSNETVRSAAAALLQQREATRNPLCCGGQSSENTRTHPVVSKYWMQLKTQEVRESVLPRSTACHSPLRPATLSRCVYHWIRFRLLLISLAACLS